MISALADANIDETTTRRGPVAAMRCSMKVPETGVDLEGAVGGRRSRRVHGIRIRGQSCKLDQPMPSSDA